MVIWKYPIAVQDNVTIKMPKDAQILWIESQCDQPCIWAMVDSNAKKVPRYFQVIATGEQFTLPVENKYLGTVQVAGGTLIFHVFEVNE